ncbi:MULTISPECIES: methionine ABC transporter ATP-binding protein [Clostridium]|uniref:methionine ABC transporter ATP-binding protein n=1 Tax=Clostridium TaxID=1485 RepID=UPI00069FA0E6|nr:methionine ABC transporter ATP-binding protein [Clostridium sp. DMHC 10]KOF55735.1 methionine ABC transporter ATP-binding protein [Clostridium sp. DMHC 10]MCD2348790.1 methionine ABC transporter ATP-binding protein [Clostridium guangxiense]
MIELKNIIKVYEDGGKKVEAVKDVSLEVENGEVLGIIGYSGAGKSTLVRCINLLEKPTSGQVIVDDKDLTKLSQKELRKVREKIGMIFQHFNLMARRNVFDNVAYPLKGKGLNKKDIANKVNSLLGLVGLEDKALNYPSQLSGGQKQRVAIARALANDPQVLLCDEATSALDPETTQSILKLIKEINEKLGLTIVIITHQMDVVKDICQRVIVMEEGEIVEKGDIVQIFTNPKAKMTKKFMATVFHYDKVYELIEGKEFASKFSENDIVAKLSFVGSNAEEAFISEISRRFKVDANIISGNIEIIQGTPIGNLVVKFSGFREGINGAIKYLNGNSIYVEVIKYGESFEHDYA